MLIDDSPEAPLWYNSNPQRRSIKTTEMDIAVAKKKTSVTTKEESLEKQLWKAADKLRKNIDAAEYKHVVLGLIFLKYISDSLEEMFNQLNKAIAENLAKVRMPEKL